MPYVTSEEAYLMHHGVKGMKWGVRKDRSSSGSRKGGSSKQSLGAKVKGSVKDYVNKPLTERVSKDVNSYFSTRAVGTGLKVTSSILSVAGKQSAAEFTNMLGDAVIAHARDTVKQQIKADVALSAGKVAYKGVKSLKDKSSDKKTFKQKMVEKHGGPNDDVEGDPNNYSWNRKASAKAAAKEQKASEKKTFKQKQQEKAQDKATKQRIADMADAFDAIDRHAALSSQYGGATITQVRNSKTGEVFTKKDVADARRQLQKEVDKINDPKEKARYQKMINSLGR